MTKSAFPIVGIGAGAGGLYGSPQFFAPVPDDCSIAFDKTLHVPADRKSILPEILALVTRRCTELAI